MVIHVREEAHYELAVHAIGDTAVAWDGVAKILDLEGAFEARGKETSKRRDERGECAEDEDVYLHWGHGKGLCVRKPDGEVVGVGNKDGVLSALEASPHICSKILFELD